MKTRLILIDGHASIREMLAASLSAGPAGCEIVGEAGSGAAAVALCARLRPAVAVTSLGLEDAPGPEIVRRLREAQPDCRVLIYSGATDRALVVAALRAGPAGFVHRSEPLGSLRAAVDAAARGASYFSPLAAGLLRGGPPGNADGGPEREISAREQEILALVAAGLSNKEISARLHLAVRTVENHRARLQGKLHLRGVAELTRFALRSGLGSDGAMRGAEGTAY